MLDALRRGTVPHNGLDLLAVGLDRFETALDDELRTVAGGGSVFKAVRGEYGAGKTFFSRWLGERAKRLGMAVAEVQISDTQTPLHRLETVYRRVCESLETAEFPPSAFRPVLDAWLFALEAEEGSVEEILERRLADVSRTTPAFSAALRGYRQAQLAGDEPTAEGLVAWLGGQPHVSACDPPRCRRPRRPRPLRRVRVPAGTAHRAARLRPPGHGADPRRGRDPAADALRRARQGAQRAAPARRRGRLRTLPGLYLLITGTPAFFDGPQGMQRLPPLAQRLATDFTTDARFDNPRAIQLRLTGFSQESLQEVGRRVRDLYAGGTPSADRVSRLVDDAYVSDLAGAVAGTLGGKVGIAPRVFLKKLVGDVLDRVDQFEDFDPRQHYQLTVADAELNDVERNAHAGAGLGAGRAASVDDIEL